MVDAPVPKKQQNEQSDRVDAAKINVVMDTPARDKEGSHGAAPDTNLPIVAKHEVGKDGRTDYLLTEDHREFRRNADGTYVVTVPTETGRPPLPPVIVNDVSVVNGTLSYRIGNFMAVEGHGKRLVSNLLTGETVDHSRKVDSHKKDEEQTTALKERLLNGGTDADRLKALRGLIDLSRTEPSAARFLDEASRGAHDRADRPLSKLVVAETVQAETLRLQQALSSHDLAEQHAALRALTKFSSTSHNSEAEKALKEYVSPAGKRDEQRAARLDFAQLMEQRDPFAKDGVKCTPAVLEAAAQVLEERSKKGPLSVEQARFAAGAIDFAQSNIKDSTATQNRFATVLGAQMSGPGASDAMQAIQTQLGSQLASWPDSLVEAFKKGLKSDALDMQTLFCFDGAPSNNAIKLLAAITAGGADKEGSVRAQAAADILLESCRREREETPGSHKIADSVINALLAAHKEASASSPDQPRDGVALPTIAQIAGTLKASEISPEVSVLVKYDQLKSSDSKERKDALATNIIESAETSPAAMKMLDQIIARDKTGNDAELLRKTRETRYLKEWQAASEDYPYKMEDCLKALKKLASIEGSSTAAKEALDTFAKKSSDTSGLVSYVRLNNEGGAAKVLEGAGKAADPVIRVGIWKAAGKDLSLAADQGPLSAEQISLAANAKVLLQKDGWKWDHQDYKRDYMYSDEYKQDQRNLDKVLKQAIAGGSQDVVALECLKVLKSEKGEMLQDSREGLGKIYLDCLRSGIKKESFPQQLETITALGKTGDRTALAILISLTAGVGDRYDQDGKEPIAAQASKTLIDTTKADQKLAQSVGLSYETVVVGSWAKDDNRMMETFAKLAGNLPVDLWGMHVIVRRQADRSASQPDSPAFKSAIKGLITLGSQGLWELGDAKAMLNTITPEIAEGIKKVFPRIEGPFRQHIMERLTAIASNDTISLENRKLAQETFKSLNKYATKEQIGAVDAVRLPPTDDRAKEKATTAPKTSSEILRTFLPKDFGTVGEADMPRIKKLVAQLGADTALERDSAAQRLAEYGSAIIPILAPLAKDSGTWGADISLRSRQVIGAVMEKQAPLLTENINQLLKPEPGKPVDTAKLAETIKALDAFAADPNLRMRRKEYLDDLAKVTKDSPADLKRVQQGLEELRNIDQLRAQVRVRLAGEKSTAGDKEGARQLLTEAVTINPGLVRSFGSGGTNVQFSRVFVNAQGSSDTVLTTAYTQAGGNARDLAPRSTASMESAAEGQKSGLKIEKVLESGKDLFREYDNETRPYLNPEARAKRMDEILRNHEPSLDREMVGMCLDQYKAAQNDFERNQAIDSLKKAVQNGNNYALDALRRLATLDAGMRLSDAMNTISSPLASTGQKDEAQKKKDAAVLDLARQEYSQRSGAADDNVGSAKGVMDYLAKGAAPGITSGDVEKARKTVDKEVQQRQVQVSQTVQMLSKASGASREEGIQRLEQLSLDQIGTEFPIDLSKPGAHDYTQALRSMQESDVVKFALQNIENPRKLADGLMQLGELERRGLQGRLIDALWDVKPDGQALAKAIREDDRGAVERLVDKQSVKDMIKQGFGPRDQLTLKLAALKTEDVLKALEDPAKLEALLKVAEKEAKENQKRVDDLVSDFLLRTTPGKPARDALAKALPAEDKPFRLPDDKEMRSQLQAAVDLEQLPARVATHAKTLLSGGELSAQDVKELRADLNVTDEKRRQDAIAQLNKLSFDNLHTTYRFESVVKALEALEQGQGTNGSVKNALKLFDPAANSNAEDKTKAVDNVIKNIEKMRYMEADHVMSSEMLIEFEKRMEKKFPSKAPVSHMDKIVQELKSGDDARITAALKSLNEGLPDATAKLDEYRAARIVRGLGPQSKPADYEKISKQLGVEIEASRKEGGQTNESAVDWQKWASATASVAKITEAADKNTPAKAKEAVDDLVKEAKAGNPYARAALAAVLVGDQENSQIAYWMRSHTALNGDRPIYVPNFRSMSPEVKTELARSASAGLLDISKSEKLTTEETSAVALALAKTTDKAGDKQTIENLTATLNTAIEGKSTKETLIGIFQALESDVKGSKVLAGIYLKGVNDPEFAKQFGQLKEFAKDFDGTLPNDKVEASYKILSGIAGGMADKNANANPLHKVWKEGKEVTEEVNPISQQARRALEEAAQIPGARTKVVEALLGVHEMGKTDARFKDNNQLLASLGTVAAELGDGEKGQRSVALAEIRESVKTTAATPGGVPHQSAVDGFFAMAKHWQKEDLEVVKTTFTDTMIKGLHANASKILPEHRTEIIGKLVENISSGKDAVSFETRLNSVRALTAFGQYLNTDQVSMLASFGGDGRYNNTSNNVKKVLEEYKVEGESSRKILETIANHPEELSKVLADLKIPPDQQEKIKAVIASTKNGSQILEELKITGDQAKLFKATVAEGLLSVLVKAPYNLTGKEGPRELAFGAFRDVPWPIATGEVKNGKPVIISDVPAKDGTQASYASTRLRIALVDYYMGKPITNTKDLQLSDQINRIVDNAKLPRPTPLIILKYGLEGTPIEKWKPGDPPTVLQISDQIIRNYTKDGKDGKTGQEVLRQVMANVEQINALPGNLRADIMGWHGLNDETKTLLGWEKEPSPERKKALNWDKLKPEEQEAIRWQNAKINPTLVIGQMCAGSGELQNSPLTQAVLLKDIPAEVNKLVAARERDIYDNKHTIRFWQEEKKKNLDEFVKKTEKGANFGNQLVGFFTGDNGRDADLNREQSRLAESFGRITKTIARFEEAVAKLEQDKGGMRLSRQVREYTETLNAGDQALADRLAMNMWTEHGPMFANLAPRIWRDLTISTDTTLQGDSMLKRLKSRGQAHWDSVPGYTSGATDPRFPYDKSKGLEGMREALGLKAAYSTPVLQTIEKNLPANGKLDPANKEFKDALKEAIDRDMLSPKGKQLANDLYEGKQLSDLQVKELRESLGRGLLQLQRGEGMVDTVALRTHMLGRVDQDPVLMKFSNQSRKMGEDLNELNKMFGAAMKGSVYEDTINVMKEKAQRIKDGLKGDPDNPITRQDLYDLSVRIKTMDEALTKMKAERGSHNEKAIEDLESRVKTFKGMHNLFNKFDNEPKYPEVMDPARDEKGVLINQNKQINQMLDRVLSGGLTASTFTNWCKENGVLIGVTIAACAATVAACATFGVASPAAVGLWVAVVGLAAREITNEVLFQVNKDGYTGWGNYDNKGSRVGDWNRKAYAGAFKDEGDALLHLLTDVAGPYLFEIGRDWLAFVATAGLMNRMFGGMNSGEAVKALFKVAPPRNAAQLAFQAERMSLIENGANTSQFVKSYLQQFMKEFGKELLINSGFSGVHTGLETGIHKGLGREQVEAMGEWGQFGLSFALSTALAMGQGALHSQVFKHGSFEPGSKFKFQLAEGVTEGQMVKFMNQQGMNAKQIAPGRWEILPVGASPNMVPITMENVERGVGRPPADLYPDGHPPARQSRPVEETVQRPDGPEWQQSPKAKEVLRQIDQFTEAFMKGDVEGINNALNLAASNDHLPAGTKMQGVPTDAFDAALFKTATPAQRAQMLQDFMENISGIGKLHPNGNTAIYPEIIVKFGQHEFNLRTGEHVGAKPPPEVIEAFNAFRTDAGGKRLLAEQALTAMEEKIHLLHKDMGNEAFSAEYVKFKRDRGEWSDDHLKGGNRSDGSEQARASLEQEAILGLYQKGWSLEMLDHHFGGHHQAARADALNWIRCQEALANPTAKFKGQLSQLEKAGVERPALEKAIRSGRVTPDDVDTLTSLVKKGNISGDDLNGYIKNPNNHSNIHDIAVESRVLLDSLKSINDVLGQFGDGLQQCSALKALLKDMPKPELIQSKIIELQKELAKDATSPAAKAKVQEVTQQLIGMHEWFKDSPGTGQPTRKATLEQLSKTLEAKTKQVRSALEKVTELGLKFSDDPKANRVLVNDAIDQQQKAVIDGQYESKINTLDAALKADLKAKGMALTPDVTEMKALLNNPKLDSNAKSDLQQLIRLREESTAHQSNIVLLKAYREFQTALDAIGKPGQQGGGLLFFVGTDPPPQFQRAAAGTATPEDIAFIKRVMGDPGGGFANQFQKIKQVENLGADESKTSPSLSQNQLKYLVDLKTGQLRRLSVLELELRSAQAAADKPNSTFEVDGTKRKWSVTSTDGSARSVEAPLTPESALNRYGPGGTSKEVGEPGIKVKVVGADGDVHEINIPKDWKVRTAVPDSADGYAPKDPSEAGLIFWDPKGKPGPNGTTVFTEIRISPPTAREHVHANYSNGYVRKSEVHVKNAGTPGQGELVQRVHLDMSGKPFRGLDGKQFGLDYTDGKQSTDAYRVIHNGKMYRDAAHINEAPPKGLGPGTLPQTEVDRLNLELQQLKDAQREFQVQTHGYLAPNGYKPK